MREVVQAPNQVNLPLGHDVVKWDNAMNGINLASLSAVELNLFTAICAQVVERESDEIHLSYSALRELMQYSSRNRKRFARMVVKATARIRQFSVSYQRGTKVGAGQLFYNIEADTLTGDVTVAVNRNVLGVLNDLTNNFTLFLQPDWVKLDSKYAKLAYLLVMQWRTTGRNIDLSVAEFRERLGVTPALSTRDVTRQVIRPIEEQLNGNHLIENFKITPIEQGRKYVGYRLSFAPLKRLTTTNRQAERISRLTEIAEAKDQAKAAAYTPADRKILADGALDTYQVRQRLRQNQATRDTLDVPLFKLTD